MNDSNQGFGLALAAIGGMAAGVIVAVVITGGANESPATPTSTVTRTVTATATAPALSIDPGLIPRLCANEDGSGSQLPCVWDAKRQGNGIGNVIIWFACDTAEGRCPVVVRF